MRGSDERQQHDQQRQKPCCVSGPFDYDATGQRGCDSWSNGDFLRDSNRHSSSQLPMAEERDGYLWRDFFFLYDPSCDGCGRPYVFHRSR